MLEQRLLKAQFERLIPHTGNMILIDEVESWTEQQIICRSKTHQRMDNPLRLAGKLSALHLLEYGAQAMAIHGGLLRGQVSAGFLAAVRDAQFFIDTLDAISGAIVILAIAELSSHKGAVYRFTVTDKNKALLIEARATVINL